MSDNESEKSANEEIIEETSTLTAEIVDNDDNIVSDIQSGKPKKPRTEKQIKALEKARETRKANALKKKKLEEDNVKLYEDNKKLSSKLNKKTKPKKQKIIYESDDEEPSDDEVIIVKRKPKKKKPPKKVVYESESSDSDDDEPVKDIQKSVSFSNEYEYADNYNGEYNYNYATPLKYSDLINFG